MPSYRHVSATPHTHTSPTITMHSHTYNRITAWNTSLITGRWILTCQKSLHIQSPIHTHTSRRLSHMIWLQLEDMAWHLFHLQHNIRHYRTHNSGSTYACRTPALPNMYVHTYTQRQQTSYQARPHASHHQIQESKGIWWVGSFYLQRWTRQLYARTINSINFKLRKSTSLRRSSSS